MTTLTLEPKKMHDRVFELLMAHHKWFEASLPLIASENIPSIAVRKAIISDFGNRYAEGCTGERVYACCRYIDQVEQVCIDLAKTPFTAEFAAVRHLSGT